VRITSIESRILGYDIAEAWLPEGPPEGIATTWYSYSFDTFHTDAGQYWLAYCSPGSGGVVRTPSLTITVTFADDDGRVGEGQSKIDKLR